MPPYEHSFSDATPRNINVEILRFSIELAETPAELRESYGRNQNIIDGTSSALNRLAETATAKLWSLGLDLHGNDERLSGFQRSIDGLRTMPDERTSGESLRARRIIFLHSYYRILSAINPASSDRLQLLPQAPLVDAVFPEDLLDEVLSPGDSKEDGDRNRHSIIDPDSRFWRCRFTLDEHRRKDAPIGKNGSERVTIHVPTGTISKDSVLALRQFEYFKSTGEWKNIFSLGYVPSEIRIQNIKSFFSDQVDTTGHFVEALLHRFASTGK